MASSTDQAAPGSRRYDAFISHASEDKEALVRPLAARLRSYGARVWYDEFELRPGDSLVAKIDRGLADSAYGVLVISPAFLEKPWPEYERQGLVARDIHSDGRVIIPIWHNVDARTVSEFSPTLAQRVALLSNALSADELALRLLDVLRPDLAEGHRRAKLFDEMVASTQPAMVPTEHLKRRPEPVHETLPAGLRRRIRLMQGALFEVLPVSYDETVENFKRDLRPEQELERWEAIAGVYVTLVRELRLEQLEARRELFSLLLGGYSGFDLARVEVRHLRPEHADVIRSVLQRRQTSGSSSDDSD